MTINTTLVAASAALSKLAAYMDTHGPLALCEKHGDDVLDNCITVTEAGGKLSPESQLMLDIVTATKSQPESDPSDEGTEGQYKADDESKPSPRKGKARTVYAVTFAIPGKPKTAKVKTFFLPAKAKRRAERLSRRGYEVNVAKVAA